MQRPSPLALAPLLLVLLLPVTGCGGDATPHEVASTVPECVEPTWQSVSRTCWNCICETCTTQTTAMTERDWEAIDCVIEAECLSASNVEDETACIVEHCGDYEDTFGAMLGWDLCLILESGEMFSRACEDVCADDLALH
jgi:hypothetical protein